MTEAMPSEEDRFHRNVVDMSNLIGDLVTIAFEKGYNIVNPALVTVASNILNSYDKTKLITNFIEKSHPHWKMVLRKNELFFIEHAQEIFGDLPLSSVDAFKKLFTLVDDKKQPVIEKEDRESIWDFFHSLVKICIKHIHTKRCPGVKINADGTKEAVYQRSYYDQVPLVDVATEWGVKLEFHSKKPT